MFLSKRSGGIYYVFYNNPQGKRTCISTRAKKKSDAMKFLTRFREEIKKRESTGIISIRLSEFINKFRSHSAYAHSYSTSKDYISELNQFAKFTSNIHINEITQKNVNEYLRERGKISVYTSSKALRYLKSIFNWAIIEQYLTENPCKNIKPIKTPEKQPLFLSEKDFETLINSVKEKDLKDVIIFAANTGLRKMEILTLEWTQINLRDRYAILDNNNGHTTKSKRVRTVPLNQKAMEIVQDRKKLNNNLVFTYNGESLNPYFACKKFKKYAIKAGLNPMLKFHSLRHTFASWLVQRGISLYQVSKLLGHSDIKTTETYSHLSPENFRSAVDSLN